MKIGKYRIYKAIIAGGLGAAVAIAIGMNAPIIALVSVVIAVALSLILERKNKEIVRDERIMQISGKAASFSFSGMLLLAAAIALGTALFRSQLPENIVFVGAIMGYFVCFAVLLHFCFYTYFSRKL